MADKKQSTSTPSQSKTSSGGGQVVSLVAEKCVAEGCKSKPDKANFCKEHYTWFKEGLLTLEGKKAKDFDKKYHAWMRRKAS